MKLILLLKINKTNKNKIKFQICHNKMKIVKIQKNN